MSAAKFGIASKQIVCDGGMKNGAVIIEDGTICDIVDRAKIPANIPIEDVGESVVMAGLVDSHVHVNEPGRTEWEGFTTATRAAAAGGITTIADMPLNSIPVTTTLDAFNTKLESTRGKLFVDCAFFGGVVPGNTSELQSMIDAGVVGFKCFLIHSGIDDFPNVAEVDLLAAMPVLAQHHIPLLVHAELECGGNEHAHDDWNDQRSYAEFLASRPRRWENEAIKLMINLCKQTKCPVHIVHLSSADALPDVRCALAEKLPFTVETCPHYLTFAAEEIADGDTRFKCAPPIRERENREKLWGALRDGYIGIVVSDHSPCTPDIKFLSEGDLKKAWGGISSLQFRLPAVWSEASKRGFEIRDISKWLCEEPARFLGLDDRKGHIAPGFEADLVVWDPSALTVFEGDNILHKHKVTPYEGRQLRGRIGATYLRGEKIFDGRNVVDRPRGNALLRKQAKQLVGEA